MLVLKNAYIVQFQPAEVEGNKDIVIDGSEIIDVGQNIAANYPDARVIDLNGDMVTPGIVCSHNHFYSGLMRRSFIRAAWSVSLMPLKPGRLL
mgnify:CR=1 FL=1